MLDLYIGSDLMEPSRKNEISLSLFQRYPWEVFGTFTFPDDYSADSSDKKFIRWIRELSKTEKIQTASMYVLSFRRKHSPPHIHALLFGHDGENICLDFDVNLYEWERKFFKIELSIISSSFSYKNCCDYLANHLCRGQSYAATFKHYNQRLLKKMNLRENTGAMEYYQQRMNVYELLHSDCFDIRTTGPY